MFLSKILNFVKRRLSKIQSITTMLNNTQDH
jgi:hypothetical protein